jgi:hypothetical protein
VILKIQKCSCQINRITVLIQQEDKLLVITSVTSNPQTTPKNATLGWELVLHSIR